MIFYILIFGLQILTDCFLYAEIKETALPFIRCIDDKQKYEARSEELQQIVKADQRERQDWHSKSNTEMQQVALRDRNRRERVGAIFGEGCFKDAKDYSAAALVFQHGDSPCAVRRALNLAGESPVSKGEAYPCCSEHWTRASNG